MPESQTLSRTVATITALAWPEPIPEHWEQILDPSEPIPRHWGQILGLSAKNARAPEIPDGWRQVHAATRGEFLQRTWRELLEDLDPHPLPAAGLTTRAEPAKSRIAGWLFPVPRWQSPRVKLPELASLMSAAAAIANAFPAALGWLHLAALSFFQSAQFQSIVRSSLKMGGLYLWLFAHPGTDPNSAAALNFANEIAGIGLIGYGLILSYVAHSGKGAPISGTASAPAAAPVQPQTH
jgi:hypothetical protein